MAKTIVTKAYLNTLIGQRSAVLDACKESKIGEVYWHEPDIANCNWNIQNIRSNDWEPCYYAINDFIIELKTQYNIEDER